MVLSALSFILWSFLSYGAFVHFCFSLFAHVIPWRECWLSTPVSCDHGIVHLDCWSIKIFSLLDGFVRFEFYPLGLLSYAAFIFSCPPTWSFVLYDHAYLIVGILKYFPFFYPLRLFSFVHFSFSHPRDRMMRILVVHPCIMWSWDRTPWLFYTINLWGFCLIFLLFFPPTWYDEMADCPPLSDRDRFVGVLFSLLGFCPLWVLYGAFVHFCFSLSVHVIPWRECWLSTPVSCDHGIVHLDCWSIKIFSLLDGFVRFEFYPLGLLSYGAFVHFCFSLSAHVITWRECWLSTPISYDHGIVHLDCWNIKIFSLWGGFVRFEFYPLGLLSYGAFVHFAFLCPPTWSHDENVGCPPLYHVIMGSYTLIVLVLKYFLFLAVLSALSFILLFLLSYGAFIHFCFSLSAHVIGWRECWLSTLVSCDHGIVHLDCWSIKIFSLLGGFVRFEFYPLGLLSCGAFVHFCFSLSAHVIAWRECWLSTPVSCDHGIVHLDCWSIKIFSLFGGFLSALSFILWGFCPMALLSIFAFLCPPTWSHDENVDCPPLYHVIMGSYTLIVGVLKYFVFGGVLSALSFILWAFVLWRFCPFCFSLSTHMIAWRECWLSTPVSCDHGIVHLDCWSIKIFSLWGGFVHFEF